MRNMSMISAVFNWNELPKAAKKQIESSFAYLRNCLFTGRNTSINISFVLFRDNIQIIANVEYYQNLTEPPHPEIVYLTLSKSDINDIKNSIIAKTKQTIHTLQGLEI